MEAQSENQKETLVQLEDCLKEITQTSLGRRAFLTALPLLLSSCASSKKGNRHREGDNSGQQTSLTVEDEKKMTAEVLPEMRKDYPPIQNAELQSYIQSLGNTLIHKNGLHQNPYNYNFTVVGVNYVNAFALPAGTVFITAPLIAMAESEAELAGVVGHEIGHIKARHTAERMEVAKKEQKKSLFFAVGGGLIGGAAGFALGSLLCPPKDKECLVKASGLGVAAGAGGALLIQKYAFMANSREDEMEADRIGFKTSLNAGFSKNHVGQFYSKLLKMEEEAKKGGNPIMVAFADAMSTHPPSQERVGQMNQMQLEAPHSPQEIISSREFERAQQLAKQWIQENPPKQS